MVKKTSNPARSGIGAADKVADILAVVCAHAEGVSLTVIARTLGLDAALVLAGPGDKEFATEFKRIVATWK